MNTPRIDMVRSTLALVCLLAVVSDTTRAADTAPPIGRRSGQMYPDFLLPKLDGGYGRLSDYRGKKVFLFHFASW